MLNTIMLSEIIIPESFRQTQPSKHKLDKVRNYFAEHGKLDKPVVLDGCILTDNYIRYLVASEFGFEKVPYITAQEFKERKIDELPTTYIVGKFEGCDKEYTWKNNKNIHIEIGDKVLVRSKCKSGKNGRGIVTVVKIFTSNSINMQRHKPVIKKLVDLK